MSFAGAKPILFDRLGGLYAYLYLEDVPSEFGTAVQNCHFLPGGVYSRAGLTPLIPAPSASSPITGLSEYIDNNGNKYLFVLDALGNVSYQLYGATSWTSVAQAVANASAQLTTVAQANGLVMAFSVGTTPPSGPVPAGPIRQWDGVYFNPFSNHGPGGKSRQTCQGTTAANSATVTNVTQLQVWSPGDPIIDADGAIPAGTTVVSTNAANLTITLSQNASKAVVNTYLQNPVPAVANSSDTGTIVAGYHGLAVSFVTRSGYVTEPTDLVFWNATGANQVAVSAIPTGPNNVVARRIFVTAAQQTDIYSVPVFQINDNTTTSATLNFLDTDVTNSTLVNDLYNNFRMPDAACVHSYNGAQTIVWGVRNALYFSNLFFDGGVDTNGVPLAWIKGASFAGGVLDKNTAFYGNAWKITGNGNAACGEIHQTEAPLFVLPVTAYNVSLRASASAGATGTLEIALVSPSLGITASFTVPVASLPVNGTFTEFIGTLTSASTFTSIPSDLYVLVQTTGTPAGSVWIDHIHIFPAATPYEKTRLRYSNAFDFETFDSTDGFQDVNKDDGQSITAIGQLRWYLYIFKERSMWVTSNDSVNPPAFWQIQLATDSVGAGGPNCVTETEQMLLIASRAGPYMFLGGIPIKLGQEISTLWSTVNWSAAQTIHTSIDAQARRLRYAVPLGSALVPSDILTLDYSGGLGEQTEPGGRKWNHDIYPWPIYDHKIVADDNNEQQIIMAGSKLWEVGGVDDDGVPVHAVYQTAFARSTPTGQSQFLGAALTITGSGPLLLTLVGLGGKPSQTLPPYGPAPVLTQPMAHDLEVYGNLESERAALKVEINSLGASFQIKRIAIYALPWAVERPH